jgi:hypothetical protein
MSDRALECASATPEVAAAHLRFAPSARLSLIQINCARNRPGTVGLLAFRSPFPTNGQQSAPVRGGLGNEHTHASRDMVTFDDELKKTIRRNKLLGLWAAEKLGLTGAAAEAYSDGLAMDALDAERSDVFGKIRKDFENAGVVQSREQFLNVLNEILLKAGGLTPSTQGGGIDAAAVRIKKNLKS